MNKSLRTALFTAPLFVVAPAYAADDTGIERMATCKDSWFEWQKTNPAELKALGAHLHAILAPHGNDAYAVPKAPFTIAGLHVTQVYPNSVGMGVGFSVFVAAPFDTTKNAIEKSLGKALSKCEDSDGMKTCGLVIADKRTVMLMTVDDPKADGTLVGCYYFYEK